MLPLLIFTLSLSWVLTEVLAQDSTKCSAVVGCYQGCCSAAGNCGFGPDFCGVGCLGTCDAKAECGKYADPAKSDCPINVCCSQYGYCGTTTEFCGTGCQPNSKGGGCGSVSHPTCAEKTDAMSYDRRVGYYELFNVQGRLCDLVYPEDLLVSPLTHVNLAFVNFGQDFKMIDDYGSLVSRVTFLKARNAGLRVNVAVGGWAFNDLPTSNYFSDMASTHSNRATFISSLIGYIQEYGLDGVDIDWEYPAAVDRGGNPDDTRNYVSLVSEMRDAFDQAGQPGWEITVTIPTSYWYLRGFDLQGLQKYVSWFNLMSYDLHGMWDQHNKYTGPYLEGHTNISEIDNGLSLLWRNNVLPENIVLGFAFYGRSFTMSDASCSQPGCKFSTSGIPGSCTNTGGILSYSEIVSRNGTLDVSTHYDAVSTVKYNVYDGSQWISYDDQQSFTDKKRFLSSRCLSGLMIWAIDQDTLDHSALAGLLGDFSLSQLEGGSLTDAAAEALSSTFGAYTGQNCFVTADCTDGTTSPQASQRCPSGTSSVATAHAPLQAEGHDLHGSCPKGSFRHICCPTKAMPKNCKWNGAPVRSEMHCSGSCGSNQFLLNKDTFVDDKGAGSCYVGSRTLCCDATQVLDDCFWTDCQGPLAPGTSPKCWGADTEFQTERYDQDNGDWCSATYVSPLGGPPGSPLHDRFKRAFCCPKGHGYKNCNWSNSPKPSPGKPLAYDPQAACIPGQCTSKQTQVTKALDPPPPTSGEGSEGFSCDGVSVPPGYDPAYPYCCDPPSKFSHKWPVDPKDLFEIYYNTDESDVMWNYDNMPSNNFMDPVEPPGSEDGKDAYGFVMLDGPRGSLDNDFPSTNTIARRTAEIPIIRRSLVTTNHSIIDSTFDHAEEIIYVYCNFPQDSPECQKIWFQGAADTIIRLPNHVGEGPYARVVSMELAEPEYELPDHHIQSRSLEGVESPVYKLTFDYDFHLIKRADVVNMRVDFTNLLGYWDEITDSAPDRRKKREMYSEHLSQDEWQSKIRTAKKKHDKLRKRSMATDKNPVTTEMINHEGSLNIHRRWWGIFKNWLDRLNTVESKNVGALTMLFQKSLLLFKASIGCPGKSYYANLRIFFDTNIDMEATYAYYFSGTIVPPAVTGTYAYFGLEPSAYLGLRMTGNAQLQTPPGKYRKKIIDTLSYPGLSLKGLAAVGPTLDLWGEVRGKITLKGEMRAGATLKFDKAEVYWPQDDAGNAKYQKLLGLKASTNHPAADLISPTFDAKVQIDAAMSVLVTPEANMGIQIGGPLSSGTLVTAQLVGFINSSLSFEASVAGTTGSSSNPTITYRYGVYILYNLGYGAYASVKGFANWAIENRYAYSPSPRFTIYEQTGSFIGTVSDNARRSGDDNFKAARHYSPRRGALEMPDLKISPVIDLDETEPRSLSPPSNASMDIRSILGKRIDTEMTDAPDISQTDGVTCPAGDTAQIRLPDFRMNCLVFRDQRLENKNGNTALVPGICSPIQSWYLRNGLGNSDLTLTWDPLAKRIDERRGEACPKSSCAGREKLLRDVIGDRSIAVSCDEFPFASTEEGGNFLATRDPNMAVSATCVPVGHQYIQGNCNTILSQLQTNVAYFERAARQRAGTDNNGADNFVQWSTGSSDRTWTTVGGRFSADGVPLQRLAEYPNRQPQGGIATADYNANPMVSFMYKRNFTFGFATPSATNDGAAWAASGTGPAQSWLLTDDQFPVGTDGGDLTSIACAVNTFHQDNIYKYYYNGYCFNGNYNPGRGFDPFPSFSRCRIDFATANNKKRSIGEFNGWQITGIEMLPEHEDDVKLPADYVPSGPLIPLTKP